MAPTMVTPASYLRRRTTSPGMMVSITVLTMLQFFCNSVLGQEVVEYLPGFHGKLPFRLETGYMGVGEKEEVQLFYYLAESYSNPEEDPLILWLTGGPGCSSLSAFIYQIGPLMIDVDNSVEGRITPLILNEDTWTKKASIIFLDQPVGTGFSYAETARASYSTDTLSAKHAYDFMRKFLISRPKFLKSPLYISGDSYSGILIPYITQEVYNGIDAGIEPVMNMKGFIAGNPHSDAFLDVNGRVAYSHRMGLLSDELYQSAKENCHGNYVDVDPDNVLCLNDLERIKECLDAIFSLHILEPSCPEGVWGPRRNILSRHFSLDLSPWHPTQRFPCRVMTYALIITWANNKSVRKALHIREGTIGEWVRCNKSISNSEPGPNGNVPYFADILSTLSIYKNLTNKRCRGLVFSGDHDKKVPHTTTKDWVDALKVPITSEWRPWFVGGQIAGYTTTNADRDFELTFATVKGAGHIASESKSFECSAMIDRWFDKSPL